MKKDHPGIYSYLVFLLFALVIIVPNYINPPRNILTYDVFGYYLYLPGTFLYDQLEFSDLTVLEDINEKYSNTGSFYQVTRAPNGHYLIRYPVGLAILYLPFFLLGHLLAFWYEVPADGFSMAYNNTLLAGGILYSLIGIFFLRKILLRFFSDKVAAISLFFLVFATNYIYKAAFKGIAPHNLLFTVYALILWLTILWHDSPKKKWAFLLGLLCGLAIVSRPSEMVCLLIPLLWNVTGWKSFREKIRFFKKNYLHLALFMLGMFILAIPQLAYWKYTTGQFLFYSYNNPGEGFDFLWPYTLKVLFSFRKGWLIYTPVMIFAVIGFYFLYKENRKIFLPILAFFLANLYLVSAWSNWWYAESYGQRALVQSYAVMAIPMGYFFLGVSRQQKRGIKIFVFTIATFFLLLNIFQIWQIRHGILDASRMTPAYYFATFGKTSVSEEDKNLLLVDRATGPVEVLTDEKNYSRRMLLLQDFESPGGGNEKQYTREYAYGGTYSFKLDSNMIYSPADKKRYSEITRREYAWLRVTAYVYLTAEIGPDDVYLVTTFGNRDGLYKYRNISLADTSLNIQPGKWSPITVDYMTPEVRSRNDNFSAYFWNRGQKTLYIDNLKVEVFEPVR